MKEIFTVDDRKEIFAVDDRKEDQGILEGDRGLQEGDLQSLCQVEEEV